MGPIFGIVVRGPTFKITASSHLPKLLQWGHLQKITMQGPPFRNCGARTHI